VLGVAQRGEAEERADGGEAGVAGSHAVAACGLEVFEKRRDERGVEVGQIQLGGLFAGALVSEDEEQPPPVAVGGDGVGAGLTLMDEAVGEERLEGLGPARSRPGLLSVFEPLGGQEQQLGDR
jgi:hypothetical protein